MSTVLMSGVPNENQWERPEGHGNSGRVYTIKYTIK
jgi:hypothetical protein